MFVLLLVLVVLSQEVMPVYEKMGLPGCVGSMDGVNIAWARCPYGLRMLHLGKDPYPCLGFNCTVDHKTRFLAITSAMAGCFNDKTKVKADDFARTLREDPKYTEVEYELKNGNDEWITVSCALC